MISAPDYNLFVDGIKQGIEYARQELYDFNVKIHVKVLFDLMADQQVNAVNKLIDDGIHALSTVLIEYPLIRSLINRLVENGIPDLGGIYIASGGVSGVVKALKILGKTGTIKVVCHDFVKGTVDLNKKKVIDNMVTPKVNGGSFRNTVSDIAKIWFAGGTADTGVTGY